MKIHFFKKINIYNSHGFSIIEILLAVSLFSLIALGSISSALSGESAQVGAGERKRATLIADQTVEILRAFRDSHSQGFGAIPVSSRDYGLGRDNNGAWVLIPSPDTVDNFLRSINISLIDSTTKQITTTVCWPYNNCTNSVVISTYLTDWRGSAGGNPGGIKVATSGTGYAYMITTDNTLEIYDISSPGSPSKVSSMTLAGTGASPTNLFYSLDKVYITSDDSSAEMQIVDVSTPASPQNLGTLNLAVDGDDISVGDDVWADSSSGEAFVIAHNSDSSKSQFFMIDVRDATAPVDLRDGVIFSNSNQVSGALAVGLISSQNTMCTTAGASNSSGYILNCYNYDFDFSNPTPAPSYSNVISDSNALYGPSRSVEIYNGNYFTTPGGKISENNSTPFTISSNDIYDMSVVSRSGRLYAYLAVPSDLTSGLKEIDIDDINNPVIITSRDAGGTLTGVVYDISSSPEYVFGSNMTGSSAGFVSFLPTPVGINITPNEDSNLITVRGASVVHCDPTVSPGADTSCPKTYTLTNVTGGTLSYTLSASETWVTLSNTGGSLSSGRSTTVDVSVNASDVNTANLSEGTHTATLHLLYTTADITRTITLTVSPATGIKVRTN
ncbi:hypothetical protein K8Q94_02615 [Candidatus Nomurabacteria bacterium]|nr:hypothetical protein [Candidatus Nomurabacteria bacterium]